MMLSVFLSFSKFLKTWGLLCDRSILLLRSEEAGKQTSEMLSVQDGLSCVFYFLFGLTLTSLKIYPDYCDRGLFKDKK